MKTIEIVLNLGKDGKENKVYINLLFNLLDCSRILVIQKILGMI